MTDTVLALVEDTDRADAFIEAAITLVEYRQAHLVVELLAPVPLIAPDMAPFGRFYTLADEVTQHAHIAEAALLARLPTGCTAEVMSQVDGAPYLPGDARRTAPVADLIAIGPSSSWRSDTLRVRTIEALLLSAGAPLLLLPPGRSLRRVDHAALGWKRGAAATRALRELVRLAAPGARIDLVEVGDASDDSCEGVVAYLRRHGLAAEAHLIARDGGVADTLQAFALERSADLLAIGGYAGSRLREALFGGVTRDVIGDPRLPVLMAH